VVCAGSSVTLTASGGNSYTWLPTGPFTNTVVVTPASATSYTVVATNGNCSSAGIINIAVNSLPNVTASASPSTICAGSMATLTASGGINYSWSTGASNTPVDSVSPGATTTYTVMGIDNNSCTNTGVVTVTVDNITVSAGNDITICPGFTAHLSATVTGNNLSGLWYDWNPDSTLNDTAAPNPSANPHNTLAYTVEVGNSTCYAKDSVTVFVVRDAECVIHIYNGITPNHDGNNDIWFIDGIESFPDNNVKLFNRWGAKVWEGTNYDNKTVVWTGKNQAGEDLPDGTYYYSVELYDTDGSVLYSASKWVEVTH
jgi:gliding motility-associated-like protein